MGGLQRHLTPYLGDLEALARQLRAGVKARTGISVCVGVAPIKTLAKLANRLAKKDPALAGVLYLDSAERRAWALGPKGGGPVPWQGQAAWRTPAYTIRLEDLLMVFLF